MDVVNNLRAKAHANRVNAEHLRSMVALNRTISSLSDHPLWKDYADTLKKMIESKLKKIVWVDDVSQDTVVVPIEYKDRERAVLSAEVRLLDQLLNAPALYATETPMLEKQIGELELAADDIEAKFGVAPKGV